MNKHVVIKFILLSAICLLFAAGCASTEKPHVTGSPQLIDVKNNLRVRLYDSLSTLRAAYMFQRGDVDKINRVLGFYSDSDNTIHCLKWDFNTCGHELFHALQFKGSPTLLVDKGHEHFDRNNYTSIEP